MPKCIKDYSRR